MRKMLLTCAFALLAVNAMAEETDLRIGTYEGRFCGAPATFELTGRVNGEWVFTGRILIRDTGQYDKLRIEQYSDNSLKIERRLSGSDTGKRQWAVTNPPDTRQKDGRRFVYFFAARSNGVGCNNGGTQTWLQMFF